LSDPIAPETRQRIEAELDALGQVHGVRILLAIESGSRAWGFPSLDSDYDVRFLYCPPVASYLTVTPERDVIERPVDAVLDIGGWDLRKALALTLKSNAVIHEWLTSPIFYRRNAVFAERLLALTRDAADLNAHAHHYLALGRRSHAPIAAGEPVRLKTYCYALRAALCLDWVTRIQTPAPMDLPSLLAGLDPRPETREAIADLVARKAEATEGDITAPLPILDRFIGARLAESPPFLPSRRGRATKAAANALLAEMVLAGPSGQSGSGVEG
jgi:predicted nucleotidyltransferase